MKKLCWAARWICEYLNPFTSHHETSVNDGMTIEQIRPRNVMAIEPKWLVELAPAFSKKGDPTKLTKVKKAQKIEPLHDRFNPQDSWRLSKRRG